jgi:hypothetical protein
VKDYGQLIVSTDAGIFLGAVETMDYDDGKLTMEILVTEDLGV